ncbi:dehalogenase [Zafaria cholistanensis]|uniref:Dehalogenase n=1 Tax=Zafaria cholistanensis TaxID=1682741 RepID=A0A5A7NSZ4_9MICC|nr:haloacid dehalogenase type II [Zafaria cholistanensis]GER23975.1 dehalogenase [Zafaria cholistanensis]
MIDSPDVIVFDVNGTLSDMGPLAGAFIESGAPGHLATQWFATVLRDGFAVTAAGGSAPFAQIAQDNLSRLLTEHGVPSVADGTGRIMEALRNLGVHPDVPSGVEALAGAAQLVTLSNGSAQVAQTLLETGGLLRHFTRLLSVEDAPGWKPARSAYAYAAVECGVAPSRMLLVAVHPWDIHGAHAAGLRTAWLNRSGAAYPGYFTSPDIEIPDLPALARQLATPRP